MQANAVCLPRTISLSRPWPLRWLDAAGDGLKAVSSALAALHGAREQYWDGAAAAQLTDHVLRDIGAPDWVRAEASARREAEHFASVELRSSSGLFDRGF